MDCYLFAKLENVSQKPFRLFKFVNNFLTIC